MNYYVDIIDTENSDLVMQLENAARSSIRLKHSGSDEKDGLVIVGSSLFFNMNVPQNENADAVFIDLFTGDEQRYKVELRREDDDLLIWNGFLLPDAYSEPYKAGTFFVNFEATDGLGRLKGKYLPDNFYNDEIEVTTILAECLKLTGLEMPIYVSLGIDNYYVKEWHNIFINTEYYKKSDKKSDAYVILKTILNDTVSCVFQELGYWHIEGLNKRNLKTYHVASYDFEGNFIENIERTRKIKQIPGNTLTTPNVTMVPPYAKIEVIHAREEVAFPETIANEADEDWVILTGVIGEIYATDWKGNNGVYAKSVSPDYIVTLPNPYRGIGGETYYTLDPTKFISLQKKIYLKSNFKYKLNFIIELTQREYRTGYPDSRWYTTEWPTKIRYDVTFNGVIMFTNWRGVNVSDEEKWDFDETRTGEINLEFITETEGLFDIKFYEPAGTNSAVGYEYIEFRTMEIKEIGFSDEHISISEIAEDYTIEKDYEVIFADDSSAFSKCFQLAKLKEQTEVYTEIDVPVLYGFNQNGNNYSIVQLDGANLINDNINSTYRLSTLLENLEVIYNYADGEQMAIKTESLYINGSFKVRVYSIDDYTVSRQYWEKWTDAVYSIEQERYTQAVANVLRRMFFVPHPKVDLAVKMPLAFTDIIKWNYIEPSNYFIINKSWDLDKGTTTVTLNKAVYQNDDTTNPGENIPPIVEAGPTIYLDDDQTTAFINAEAFDPDGFIISYAWVKTAGGGAPFIEAPTAEDTALSNLTGDFYTFQITVSDNDGATASDSVDVVRIKDHTISMTQIYTDTGLISGSGHGEYTETHWSFTVSPDLPDNYNITISAELDINMILQDGDEDVYARFRLVKNNAVILEYEYDSNTPNSITTDETFNYNNTDTIVFKLRSEASLGSPFAEFGSSLVKWTIEEDDIVFSTGLGNILGLPQSIQTFADTINT